MSEDPTDTAARIFPRYHTLRFLLCGVPAMFSLASILYAIKVYPDDYQGRENIERAKDLMLDAAIVGFVTVVGLIGVYVAVRIVHRRSEGRSPKPGERRR